MFILIYSNEDDNSKRFKAKRLFTKRYNQQLQSDYQWKKKLWLSNYSDIKRYEEIRKLTTGQGEDFSTIRLSICQKSL